MVSNTVLAARDVFSPDDNDSIPDLETSAYTQTPLKKLKVLTALHQNSASQLHDVTCHMGSHSVTCPATRHQ